MLHECIKIWFHWVEEWGYLGVFILMAMESSIFPVPSEIVMPPAAFWAAQGKMGFWGVVLVGTLGSYFGSVVSYWLALVLGKPVVDRYGKYFLLSQPKIKQAENWIIRFGVMGIFFARLLPVVRHLISIPAGIFRMRFVNFSLSTLLGAGLWCFVLSWFGKKVIGDHPELLRSPEEMLHVMQAKSHWVAGGVLLLLALYIVAIRLKKNQ